MLNAIYYEDRIIVYLRGTPNMKVYKAKLLYMPMCVPNLNKLMPLHKTSIPTIEWIVLELNLRLYPNIYDGGTLNCFEHMTIYIIKDWSFGRL